MALLRESLGFSNIRHRLPDTPLEAEPEDLIGYMGNMAKNAISRKRREQRKIENAYREGYQF